MSESRRLGRGLEALLGPISKDGEDGGGFRELAPADIRPNPFQPRREFEAQALQELADSIAASGLLQPIVVRPRAGHYELIAGERRWRAVQQLGWEKIPAVIKEVDDASLLTLALIENLQRDELSPLDAARGYDRLMQEFQMSQAEVARLVGKGRATVANTVRLLKLPSDVLALVEAGDLSEGHGRALLAIADPERMGAMARAAAKEGWSVRDLEARVRGAVPGAGRRLQRAKVSEGAASAEVARVEDALRQRLQTDVRVTARRRGRGFVTITYYSNDDLARLLAMVLGEPFDG